MNFVPPDAQDVEKLLAPRYAVHSLLGRGGMGAVYLATQTALERLVAIKILPTSLGRELSFAKRFRREARLMAQLNHPNIVNVHDFGQMGEGLWYFVMEYVDGVNLECYLRRQPVGLGEKLRIIDKVCAALQCAHEQGVIHRDIKPLNILLTHGGQVKMVDFGLGKGTTREQTMVTKSGLLLGSPYFAAPEQFDRDRQTDHRTDIYSLGVLIYYILTGTVPCGTWELPSKIADVDAVFDGIVQRAMSSDPENRHQSVREIRDLLRPLLHKMDPGMPDESRDARPQEAPAVGGSTEDRANETLARLKSPLVSQDTLLGLWAMRSKARRARHSDYYIALGGHLTNRGSFIWAHDVAAEGHAMDPGNIQLRQLKAKALMGGGAHEESADVLSELMRKGIDDEETLSLLADCRRNQWQQAQSAPEQADFFHEAVHLYQEIFARSRDEKSGIDAAVLTAMGGSLDEARTLARAVLACASARPQPGTGQERTAACLGEAYLILGEMEGAREHFRKAASRWLEEREWRLLDATRRQALLLAASLNLSAVEIDGWFPRPDVVVFAGHRFEAPGQPGPRFLFQTMSKVREAIAEWLDRRKAHIAFSSASTGVDLLFIEAMLERGREVHVVLPFKELARDEETVELNSDPSRPDRLQAVLKQAASVTHAARGCPPHSPRLFSLADHVLFGLARHHAGTIGANLMGLAMWDGSPPCGKPGAANSVALWRRQRCPITQINPLKFYDTARKPTPRFPLPQASAVACQEAKPVQDDFRAFLFVDRCGPAGQEEDAGLCSRSLDLIARTMGTLSALPLTCSDSDGGLCLVFNNLPDAVHGARRLREEFDSLPAVGQEQDSPHLLITLHAGLCESDPATQKPDAPAVRVNRITNLAPIHAKGRIYASQSFAALAAAQGIDEFHCIDLGAVPVAEGAGIERVYMLPSAPPAATPL